MLVPSSTVFLLTAEIIIAVTTPLVAFAILRFRKLTGWAAVLSGFAAYLVINLAFENLIIGLVLKEGSAAAETVRTNPLLYVLFAGGTAVLFDEGTRYLVFRFVLKGSNSRYDGIAYGEGFACMEAIAYTFMTSFVYVMYSGLINESGAEAFISSIDDKEAAADLVDYLINKITTGMLVMDTIERLICIIIQICLSLICFYAVKKKCMNFFWLSCVLHFLFVVPGALTSNDVIPAGAVGFAIEVFVALILAYVAARIFRGFDKPTNDLKKFFGIGIDKKN